MFQCRGFPPYHYLFMIRWHDMTHAGFPHSEICGSKTICVSPQLIAAYRVLRRLLMPRHSPCALISLTNTPKVFLPSSAKHTVQLIKMSRLNLCVLHSCIVHFMRLPKNYLLLFLMSLHYLVFKVQMGCLIKWTFITIKATRLLLVGLSGLEPPTSRLSGVRSNRLSYKPILKVVETKRIELLTPCLQGRCSPSWATPPRFKTMQKTKDPFS